MMGDYHGTLEEKNTVWRKFVGSVFTSVEAACVNIRQKEPLPWHTIVIRDLLRERP